MDKNDFDRLDRLVRAFKRSMDEQETFDQAVRQAQRGEMGQYTLEELTEHERADYEKALKALSRAMDDVLDAHRRRRKRADRGRRRHPDPRQRVSVY